MSDEQMDDIFRELQDDLAAVRPSPEFAAKVRQRVAAQPERTWFGVWQISAAASVVTVAVLAVIFWRAQVKHVDSPSPVVITAQNPPTPPPSVASSTAETATPVNRMASRAPAAMSSVRTEQASAHEPEVIVPDDQRIALMRFLAQRQSGRADAVPAGTTLFDESTGELTSPKQIEIRPIVVEPLPGTIDTRAGGRNER